MAGFNFFQMLKAISPSMIFNGAVYPYRAARHIVRSKQPTLRGLPYWRAVLRHVSATEADLPDTILARQFGTIQQVDIDGQRVTIQAQYGKLRISALRDNLFQIRCVTADDDFPEVFSYSVAQNVEDWESSTTIDVRETEKAVTISTEQYRISIDKRNGQLTVSDVMKQVLITELTNSLNPEDGGFLWQAAIDSRSPVYGLGEKAFALNLAGRRLELHNSDPAGYARGMDPIYMSVPFLISLTGGRAVGVFFDNSYRAWADLGTQEAGQISYQASGGELRYYIMAGTPQNVLACYTELTGRSKLPPLWVFGFHQSRWSYYPQQRVEQIAEEFRQRNLPCDVLHIDIHYMDGYRCFTVDSKRFPDFKGMLDRLHEQGFKAISIIDPGIKIDKKYGVYQSGVEEDAFMKYPDGARYVGPVWPGNCHFPDFSDPKTRAWWGQQYQPLLEAGLDSFWNDMNEIALIALSSTHVPDIVEHSVESRGGTHAEVHNVYGMLMARASLEGLSQLQPDRRSAVLTRSGWAGVQRYAMHWTGDNLSTWDHLHLTIPMVINLGYSGIPITGPDVGGFSGGPSPELYTRWMQLGAFMPFYRSHSMQHSPDHEPWAFGAEVEEINRKYLELRYRLIPYIYTAAWQASQYGTPIVRSLSFAYPDEPQTYSLDDQFFFGDAFMVAPILEEGATQRTVYLPAGQWFDFWTNESLQGGQTITINGPLDTIPLFVKAGSVIPFWPVQQYIGEKQIDELLLHAYWAEGEQQSMYYEDDGESPDYMLEEKHRLSSFTLRGAGSTSGSLTHIVHRGGFMPAYASCKLHIIGLDTPESLNVSGGQLDASEYDVDARTLYATITGQKGFVLSVS